MEVIVCIYVYKAKMSTQLKPTLPFDRLERADREVGLGMRHRDNARQIRMAEVVMTAGRAG
jgi:hypothetical protein